MITNFKMFSYEHLIAILIPIIIGIFFVIISKKYPNKIKLLNTLLLILLISIRLVRYVFDIQLGSFRLTDLLSLHVCNLDLYILIYCLIKPNRSLFIFTLLIGIPTALAVALLPGKAHPEPGMLRAIFFVMSHMMLIVTSIYLAFVYKYKITKKYLIKYYLFSFIGIIFMYIFNIITKSNFMYLIKAPQKTILETMYNQFGPILYIFSIYLILVFLLSIIYFIYNLLLKNSH